MTSAADPSVIVDTGPLVAFLDHNDLWHDWVVDKMETMRAPFLTCEPVLVETFHLLRKLHDGPTRFFGLLDSGLLRVSLDLLAERKNLNTLIHKYRDLPMSLADACLVRMAEKRDNAVIFSLDSHFAIYRIHGRRRILAILPEK